MAGMAGQRCISFLVCRPWRAWDAACAHAWRAAPALEGVAELTSRREYARERAATMTGAYIGSTRLSNHGHGRLCHHVAQFGSSVAGVLLPMPKTAIEERPRAEQGKDVAAGRVLRHSKICREQDAVLEPCRAAWPRYPLAALWGALAKHPRTRDLSRLCRCVLALVGASPSSWSSGAGAAEVARGRAWRSSARPDAGAAGPQGWLMH